MIELLYVESTARTPFGSTAQHNSIRTNRVVLPGHLPPPLPHQLLHNSNFGHLPLNSVLCIHRSRRRKNKTIMTRKTQILWVSSHRSCLLLHHRSRPRLHPHPRRTHSRRTTSTLRVQKAGGVESKLRLLENQQSFPTVRLRLLCLPTFFSMGDFIPPCFKKEKCCGVCTGYTTCWWRLWMLSREKGAAANVV